ncbi:MAG TPA: hypothetical protein DEF51_14795, partial [Myxococcales bacterium]|nr:hypothetical protein [Myxococcales bacterium]
MVKVRLFRLLLGLLLFGCETGGACVDTDLDGYGPGCELGEDCDENNAARNVDCVGVPPPDCAADPTLTGCPCLPGGVQTCLDDGAGLGICLAGETVCVAGFWGLCEGGTGPRSERCDGVDDDCDGLVDEGFDFMNSEDHCGGCGLSCGPAQTCCMGVCTDTESDVAACGSCGNACGAGQGCCGGACLDVQTDAMNCGACGNVCPGTQECCGGACVDTRSDTAHCGTCGTTCSGGDDCCDGACAAPASAACTDCAVDCLGGEVCCAPVCTDTGADPANCGGCGMACAMGEACCGSSCADTDTDAANCGTCGNACSGASDTCCDGGCTDTDADPMNCGGCGV